MSAEANLGQQFKPVRMKSIPNVDVGRLKDSLAQIHQKVHTQDGLRSWEEPRRGLYNYGMKALAIRKEIENRGERSDIDCRWCGSGGETT